jgi:hypothetical protein
MNYYPQRGHLDDREPVVKPPENSRLLFIKGKGRPKKMKSRLSKWQEGKLLIVLVRVLALVLALVLFLAFSEVRPSLIPGYVLLSLAIVYSIVRILFPLYSYRNNFLTYGIVTVV